MLGEEMKINPKQIRKIKALQSRLKMPDEEYRLLLSDEFVNSCTALTEDEADRIIVKLEEKAIAAGVWNKPATGQWHGKTKYEDLAGRDGFATPPQLRMIGGIWKQISIYKTDARARERALDIFVNRIAHVTDIRFLTKRGAHEVIEALKKMKEKGKNYGK